MGYDINRFETDVKDQFICPICQDVLENPLIVPGCDHVFCSLCIKDWLEGKQAKVCPIDRNPTDPKRLQAPLRLFCNLLNELNIRCEFEPCNKYVQLQELENHVNNCIYNPANRGKEISCPNDCGAKIKFCEKHDCIKYMKHRIQELELKLCKYKSELSHKEQELDDERKNMEILKRVFDEEKNELDQKILILKQEIETNSLIDFSNRDLTVLPNSSKNKSNNTPTTLLIEFQNNKSLSAQVNNLKYCAELNNITNNDNNDNNNNGTKQSGHNSNNNLNSSNNESKIKRRANFIQGNSENSVDKIYMNLLIRNNCKSPNVKQALLNVDRRHFYPGNNEYNKIVSTKKNAHSFTLIYEIKLLEYIEPYINKDSHILDIGSGMGFLSCCLAKMCQFVVGVEHVKELVNRSQEILENYYQELKVCFCNSDGRIGCEKYAPYDLILIEPLVRIVPDKLYSQLKQNGYIIAVIKNEHSRLQMIKINRQQCRKIICDNHYWLVQNHKDTLCDLYHQEISKFDILSKIMDNF